MNNRLELKISPVFRIESFWQDKMRACFPSHFHEHFVIGCLLRGERIYRLDRTYGRLEPFQIMLINPGQIHQCRSSGKTPASWLAAHVPVRTVCKLFAGRDMKAFPPQFNFPLLSDSQALEKFLKLALNPSEKNLLELLDHIWAIPSSDLTSTVKNTGGKPEKQNPSLCTTIKDICAQFMARPQQNISLEEMAKKADMSKYTFLRKFKKLMGISPGRYLDLLRLNLARDSLCQGQSLSECAQTYGYYDQSHMHRQFTANFGFTPGQLQKSIAFLGKRGKTKE